MVEDSIDMSENSSDVDTSIQNVPRDVLAGLA